MKPDSTRAAWGTNATGRGDDIELIVVQPGRDSRPRLAAWPVRLAMGGLLLGGLGGLRSALDELANLRVDQLESWNASQSLDLGSALHRSVPRLHPLADSLSTDPKSISKGLLLTHPLNSERQAGQFDRRLRIHRGLPVALQVDSTSVNLQVESMQPTDRPIINNQVIDCEQQQ